MTTLKAISIGACILLLVGYAYRRRRYVHVPLMLSAFIIDMSLVAYIELTRHAIEKALSGPGPLMVVHILISVAFVLLYFWQIFTGIGRWRGLKHRAHKSTGLIFLLLRFGNLVTSFLVTSGQP